MSEKEKNIDIEMTITIDEKKSIVLTYDQAKELYNILHEMFGQNSSYNIFPSPAQKWPWEGPPYIHYGDSHTDKVLLNEMHNTDD